ncbi:MAG TPA: hypothetical protein VGL47_24840 [Amycolatopsis sp.]
MRRSGARSTITGVHPAQRSPNAADIPAIPSPATNARVRMAVTAPWRTRQ